jgi:hypothetical protein
MCVCGVNAQSGSSFQGFSTVYQLREHMELLRSHVFGNPHSTNKAALAKLRRPCYAGGTITLSSIIAANMLERKEEGKVTNEQYTCNTAFKTHSWSLRPSG